MLAIENREGVRQDLQILPCWELRHSRSVQGPKLDPWLTLGNLEHPILLPGEEAGTWQMLCSAGTSGLSWDPGMEVIPFCCSVSQPGRFLWLP